MGYFLVNFTPRGHSADNGTTELPEEDNLVDPARDALYRYNEGAQKEANAQKPWAKDPRYFDAVRISAVALVKMVMHARSGGSLEVMGLMQGYVDGTALVVTDAFRLPVEGTETRVNAQDEANEYLVEYLRLSRDQGRMENVVGWYHSHPGYGCWLSGIDVDTQAVQQQFNDPFVAVVVDPDRTVSAGKVEIGAFRTYPENYKAPDSGAATSNGHQTVPLNKAVDFGAHASRYYSLEVEHFRSTMDARLLELLWNKYWVQTLSQAPLFTNRDYANKQILDLGNKVREIAANVHRSGRGGSQGGGIPPTLAASSGGAMGKALDQGLDKAVGEAKQLAAKELSGLTAGDVKASVFGAVPTSIS